MMLTAALLALALAADQPAAPAFAGYYEAHEMEMAGALELETGGRFRYALDYGAVSEQAAGSWSARDGIVHLTSSRAPAARDPERSDAAFDDQKFTVAGDSLVLDRYDMVIRFTRVESRPDQPLEGVPRGQ